MAETEVVVYDVEADCPHCKQVYTAHSVIPPEQRPAGYRLTRLCPECHTVDAARVAGPKLHHLEVTPTERPEGRRIIGQEAD